MCYKLCTKVVVTRWSAPYAWLEEGTLWTLWEQGCTEDEENKAIECMHDIYERVVAHVPPGQERQDWWQYIFLWLNCALFEEIETKANILVCHVRASDLTLLVSRTTNTPIRFTILLWTSYPTNNSSLQNFGLWLPVLRYGDWTSLLHGRFWGPRLGCAQRRCYWKAISSWKWVYIWMTIVICFNLTFLSYMNLTVYGCCTKNTSK